MKKLILLLCFGIICSIAGSPPSHTLTIEFKPPYEPHEALWRAICTVESSNNPNAIGDLKLKNKSYGIAQIRQSRLDDYYRHTGIKYSVYDMFDTTKSKSVFMWYAMQYHPSQTEEISRCWNAGPNGMRVTASKKYFLKIKEILLSL